MAKFASHLERLNAVATTSLGRLLAVGGRRDADGVTSSRVHVLALPKATVQATLDVDAPVTALAFMANDVLVAGTTSAKLHAWDLSADAPRNLPVIDVPSPVRGLATDGSGKTLGVVADDGVLRILALDGAGLQAQQERKLGDVALLCVAMDPHGAYVAAGGEDGSIRSLPLADVG